MNNFESKYLKIASKYLDDKMSLLNVKGKTVSKLVDKKVSRLERLVNGIFKS